MIKNTKKLGLTGKFRSAGQVLTGQAGKNMCSLCRVFLFLYGRIERKRASSIDFDERSPLLRVRYMAHTLTYTHAHTSVQITRTSARVKSK